LNDAILGQALKLYTNKTGELIKDGVSQEARVFLQRKIDGTAHCIVQRTYLAQEGKVKSASAGFANDSKLLSLDYMLFAEALEHHDLVVAKTLIEQFENNGDEHLDQIAKIYQENAESDSGQATDAIYNLAQECNDRLNNIRALHKHAISTLN